MKRETLIWTVVLAFGAIGLLWNSAVRPGGMAKQYVEGKLVSQAKPEAGSQYVEMRPVDYDKAVAQGRTDVMFSPWRTIGVWAAAFLTLCIFSFLYRDNPFYKFGEAVFIGVSAATYMVAGFWDQIIPNVLGELAPWAFKGWALPAIELDAGKPWFTQVNWVRLIPLFLGILLLWRLAPKGQWIARWPLAVIIGSKAGVLMLVYIQTDLMGVVSSSVLPLAARDAAGSLTLWQSLRNTGIVLGILACLVYFFFSVEHKGVVGKTARLGIWVLMITFGASFALTVMGRIALLSERLQFLFDDWLWLIDPSHNRTAAVLDLWLQGGLAGLLP